MNSTKNLPIILVADDDADDRLMMCEALEESGEISLRFVENGEELIDYLLNVGKYEDVQKFPRPGIILLDLNMPKKDGREALQEIKANPKLRQIPIVVMTTSKAEEDIYRTYDLGVNSFISKPVSFEALVSLMNTVSNYWFKTVELPFHQVGE